MLGYAPLSTAPISATKAVAQGGVAPALPAVVSAFFVAELTLHRGFVDPVGPADQGILAQPNLALVQSETGAASTTTIYVSDAGYRTRATDAQGVVAYRPSMTQAFSVDVGGNIDPTQSVIAAAWGSLTLANADNFYDATIKTWSSDGQAIRILRGEKVLDANRGIFVDPPYSSLVLVFSGVMGPWVADVTTATVALRDASYYLERQVTRTQYGGTGALDGTSAMAGVLKPIVIGGTASTPVQNVTPAPVDPANLVYQFGDNAGSVAAAYDGGAALTSDGLVASLYSGSVAPGHFRYDGRGCLQVGSTPVFGLTVDIYNTVAGGGSTTTVADMAYYVLTAASLMATPTVLINGTGGTTMATRAVDPVAAAQSASLKAGISLSASDDIDGLTLLGRLLAASGAALVPNRAGLLSLMVLAPIPAGTSSVLTLNDANIISIVPQALPATINPPPWRLRLAYNRNWTVQTTNLAGSTPAARLAFIGTDSRVVTGIGTPDLQTTFARPTDPAVIGTDNASLETTAINVQKVVNTMIGVYGAIRKLYEITVPQSVGLALDWASVVTVSSSFDGLTSGGKQGQIVGWRYSNEDATSMFRVLV